MNIAAVALLAVIVIAEIARIAQVHVVDRRARSELAAQPAPPTAADVVAAARALPTPSTLLNRLVLHRYIVTMRGNEGMFGGVITEAEVITGPGGEHDLMLVLEQCSTLPGHDGDTPGEIAGRVILAMSGIAYLQQVG